MSRVLPLLWCVCAMTPLPADTIKGRDGVEVNGAVSFSNDKFTVQVTGEHEPLVVSREKVSEVVFNDRKDNIGHLPPWIQRIPDQGNSKVDGRAKREAIPKITPAPDSLWPSDAGAAIKGVLESITSDNVAFAGKTYSKREVIKVAIDSQRDR